ncbi:MAG: ABC transporter substrate-binding protein [Candidatus Buchananbacteria bacterium]
MKTKILLITVLILTITIVSGCALNNKAVTDIKTIQIGAILPLSGDATTYGKSSQNGIALAKKDLAAKYPDFKLDVIYEDSLYNPKDGVSAYQKLSQTNKISGVLIGASFIAIPIRPLADKDNVLQMAIWSSAPSYTATHNLNFRTTLTADDTIPTILDYMKAKNLSRLAIIYSNNEFGASHKNSFVKFAPDAGISIVASEGVGYENDFRTRLTKIKSLNADSIFFVGTAGQLANVIKQANDLDITAQIISQGAAEDAQLITGAGSLADGLVYAYPYDNSSADTQEFSNAYKEAYGELPNQYSAEAYAGLQLIGEAIHLCQNKIDIACWKEKLHSLKDFQTILGSGSFTDLGDFKAGKVFMKTVKDGGFVPYQN